MAWVRIDDQFPNHPKVVAAGPLPMLLHVCAMCYAGQYLTDGLVPIGIIPRLVDFTGIGVATASAHGGLVEFGHDVDPYELAEKLVEVGLWEPVEKGYVIHDFLDYNPSRQQVLAERKAARERMANVRQGKRPGSPEVHPKFTQTSTEVHLPPTPTPIITQSTNVDCVPAPVKPNPKKREPKPEPPPAVKIVHDLTTKWPASVWYEKVDQAVGRDPPNLQRWSDTITAWLGLGWNKTNVKGMLEFFERNEIPGTNGRHIHDQRPNKNHGLAGLRGGNSEYRVLSKEEWEAAKQAQRDGIDLGDGPALPDLRLPQERVAEK